MRALQSSALPFLAPIPASAQSAEETLAVMLWGLQEGARTKRVSEHLWEVGDDDGARSSVRIRRLTDCQFGVSSQVHRADRSDVLEFDYVLNFAAVHGYSAWFANGRDGRIISRSRVKAGIARRCAATQRGGSCIGSTRATWMPTSRVGALWSVSNAHLRISAPLPAAQSNRPFGITALRRRFERRAPQPRFAQQVGPSRPC